MSNNERKHEDRNWVLMAETDINGVMVLQEGLTHHEAVEAKQEADRANAGWCAEHPHEPRGRTWLEQV